MGVVYGAYDPELDRKIALKLLKGERASVRRTTARARLLREAKAMARLAHPNVIAVHDVGVFDGQVFLAMEFLGGGTLKSWLGAGPRHWREVLEVFVAAGRGLAAAHAAGLVHRDFKPENVLLDRDGRPRVVDFGLAREASALGAQDGAGARTPARGARRREQHRGNHLETLDAHRGDHGHAGLHGARAVPRRADRRAHRSVQLLRRALRGALRRAPVRAASRCCSCSTT